MFLEKTMPRQKKQKKYNIKTNKKTGEVRIYAKGKRGRVSVANAFRSSIFRKEIKSLKKKDQNLLDTYKNVRSIKVSGNKLTRSKLDEILKKNLPKGIKGKFEEKLKRNLLEDSPDIVNNEDEIPF